MDSEPRQEADRRTPFRWLRAPYQRSQSAPERRERPPRYACTTRSGIDCWGDRLRWSQRKPTTQCSSEACRCTRRGCSPPDDAHRTHRRKGPWKCHSHASHSGLHRTCWRWRWWSPPHTIACTISRAYRPLCDYRLCGVDKEESVILLRAKPNSTRIICLPSTQSNSIIANVNLPSIVHSTSSFVHDNHHPMNYNLSNLKRVR